MSQLVFFDMETTGLDPAESAILEVAAVVVDANNLSLLDSASWLIRPSRDPSLMLAHDRGVFEMHEASGLLYELRAAYAGAVPSFAVPDVESKLIMWLIARGFKPKQPMLAGFSIQFDRRFIYEQMPHLDQFLHYRMIDVSTLRELDKLWNDARYDKTADHRAIKDCFAAVECLRLFRGRLKVEHDARS